MFICINLKAIALYSTDIEYKYKKCNPKAHGGMYYLPKGSQQTFE